MGFVKKILSFAMTLALSSLFFFAGLIKVTDQVDPQMHALMVAQSSSWASVFGQLQLDAETMLAVIGFSEVIGAVLLWTPLWHLASTILSIIMGCASYYHYVTGSCPRTFLVCSPILPLLDV